MFRKSLVDTLARDAARADSVGADWYVGLCGRQLVDETVRHLSAAPPSAPASLEPAAPPVLLDVPVIPGLPR